MFGKKFRILAKYFYKSLLLRIININMLLKYIKVNIFESLRVELTDIVIIFKYLS